jgi:hypothetical protein
MSSTPTVGQPTITSAAETTTAESSGAVTKPESLEEMSMMSQDDLGRLFDASSLPVMDNIQGDVRGLVMPSPIGALMDNELVDVLWNGKTYVPADSAGGTGFNRLGEAGVGANIANFDFTIDQDAGSLLMNYDVEGNLPPISMVKDEVRQISPTLWIGRAFLGLGPLGNQLVAYFGLSKDIDGLSREVMAKASYFAGDPSLTAAQKQERVREFAAQAEATLVAAHTAGAVSDDQYDGGETAVEGAGTGGELAEIRAARDLAVELMKTDAGRKVLVDRGDGKLYSSDAFQNTTLTATASDGRSVHLRMGTHGGHENRAQNPMGDGFPFPGSKWVEGDIVVGDKIYSFTDPYTDNFKVITDASGKPTALQFKGEVEVRTVGAEKLPTGDEKWGGRIAERPAEGTAKISFQLPLTSGEGVEKTYGVDKFNYVDKNYAISLSSTSTSTITIEQNGASETIALSEGTGGLEVGKYNNMARLFPPAYHFVQGQQLDSLAILKKALSEKPGDVLAILPADSGLRRELANVINNGGQVNDDLASRINHFLLVRSQQDSEESLELRRSVGALFARNLDVDVLSGNVKTSTQFEGTILASGDRVGMGDAGSQSANEGFKSYENPEDLDPLAVLNVNHVPLQIDGSSPALLERRTVIIYDPNLKSYTLGFQEVFHRN